MRLFKRYNIKGITAYKLGWSLVGAPLMNALCYSFDHLMIDTGQSHMEKEVVLAARKEKIQRVFLTHHHEDHSGNASAVKKACGASIFGHKDTIRKMAEPFRILPYQRYIWGKATPVHVVPVPRESETRYGSITAIHTPGHARDHTAYFLKDRGVVFSGDLYLGDRIKFFRSDENITDQINSLKKLCRLDFDTLLCNHRPRPDNGKMHLKRKLNFLQDFYGHIVELRGKGLSESGIFKTMGLKEVHATRLACCGNVSMHNGVRSVLRNLSNPQSCIKSL